MATFDPISTMLEASRTGAALGGQIANNTLRMQQLQSERALNRMREQQLAQEIALRTEAFNQQVQQQADVAKATAQYQLYSTPTLMMPTGTGAVLPMPNPAYQPDQGKAFISAYLPVAKNQEQASSIVMDGVGINLKNAQAQAEGGQAYQPGFVPVTDPRTGRTYSAFQSSNRSSQLMHEPQVVPLDVPGGERVNVVQTGNTVRNLPQQGDITKRMTAQALHKQAEDVRDLSVPNPDAPGLRMIAPDKWQEFEARSRLTPGDRSNLHQRIIKLQDTNRRLQSVAEKAEAIFGPKALAGTVIVDRVLATLNPNLAVGERIQGREAARYAIEGLVRSLTQGQGALSNQDVQRIYGLFPELSRPAELANNPERSRQIIQGLQKQLALDEINDARTLGQAPSEEALTYVDPTYLIEEVQRGAIPVDQFRRAFNNNVHKADVQRLSK